jgi:hypothetical protein
VFGSSPADVDHREQRAIRLVGDEEDLMMFSLKSLVTASVAVALGLATAASTGASVTANHAMYLTFNRPVSLPGVALGTGTYIFELPEPMTAHSLVRVLSRDRKIVYFTAFTYAVDRPADLPREARISFKEAAPDRPQPIASWWPEDSAGRQFIYTTK